MAREQGERLKTGGVVVFPNSRDERGEYQWVWDPPQILGTAAEIREYPRDLDVEISRGLGIPDSVLTDSAGTGSYSGRRVPERAFYVSLEEVLAEIINALRTQIIDPLLILNFEGEQEYEIITKPLVEVMSPEATPPAGYGQGVQGMPGNNSTTVGNVFNSGGDNPDMGVGLNNSPAFQSGGVGMSLNNRTTPSGRGLEERMAENFIHNKIKPLIGVTVDKNKNIVASTKIRMSNNVEYNKGDYISLKHIEEDVQKAGFSDIPQAVEKISKFADLPPKVANTLFNSTAKKLQEIQETLEEDILKNGYNNPKAAWEDAQKISWLAPGLAYALYNKYGE